MKTKSIGKKKQEGFTLIEMIVAVALFAAACILVLSSFANVLDVQGRISSSRVANDSFSFSLETMMREIRTGTGSTYNLVGGDPSAISFDPAPSGVLPNMVIYRLNSANSSIERSSDGGNTYLRLTPPSIVIEKLEFIFTGAQGDLVTIVVSGYSGQRTKERSYFNLQTSVSARNK